ncbi:hypothetical protein RRG08_049979 [Elysia crispata]|uniref:Uncharacterized protein n=1 Tax=Elysia crispata TaxID=231223 RepID=A0AAE1B953_9GAST|nr:hypothetical protein RRG08_049979 [Elysia crispata]
MKPITLIVETVALVGVNSSCAMHDHSTRVTHPPKGSHSHARRRGLPKMWALTSRSGNLEDKPRCFLISLLNWLLVGLMIACVIAAKVHNMKLSRQWTIKWQR